ncbi:MAG: cupin domain-containing protein [Thermodesulfobacteriota bacterium]
MPTAPGQLQKLDVNELAAAVSENWKNWEITRINDHCLRLAVLQRDFHWHQHNSDETLLVMQGRLLADLEDRTESLTPGQLITIPKGVRHRTRAQERTVNLCFEAADTKATGDN